MNPNQLPLYILAALAVVVPLMLLFRVPSKGFLLLVPLAPLSELSSVESLKIVQVLGAFVLISVLFKRTIEGKRSYPRGVLLHGGIVMFLACWAWLLSADTGVVGFISEVGSFALVIAVLLIYDRVRDIEQWLWLFAVVILLLDIVTVVVVAAVPQYRLYFLDLSSSGVRFRGTFENPNFFGGAQIVAVAVFLYSFRYGGWRRFVSLAGLAACSGSLLLAQSRSALFGFLIGIALLGTTHLRSSRRPVFLSVLTFAFLSSLLLVYVNLPSQVAGVKLARLNEDVPVDYYDVGLGAYQTGRWPIVQAHFRTLAQHPWGLGYGSQAKEVTGELTGIFKMPHNFAIKEMLNYGILGGIYIDLLWFFPVFLIFRRAWRRQIPSGSLAPYLMAGLAGYLLHSLFHSMTNWVYIYVYWAFTVRVAQLETRKAMSERANAYRPLGQPTGAAV